MKLNLYQVFYKKDQPLDKDCIPINAIGINPVPLYENKYILEQYSKLSGADYYGVTSWRMFDKTNLTHKDLNEFINKNPGYDVYLYGQYGDEFALIQNTTTASPIGVAWKRLFELSLFENKNIQNENWINCFCNYWLANKKTWDRYIVYLKKAIDLLDNDPILKWLTGTVEFPHRGEKYPLHPFILEYLFGLFLQDNSDIRYIRVPNKLQNISLHKKAFNPEVLNKSLIEIYENHKTENAGLGDKGTLHKYIENYDLIFRDYRYRDNINVMEIGVQEGYSLRMWRDYFARARIVGIDIKDCPKDINGCEFYKCDQNNPDEINKVLEGENFDIIIDDGSHLFEHQVTSFKSLFPRLNPGGIYVIEDIQNPEIEIPKFQKLFGPCEIYDTRKISGRYDDILLVWKK